MKLSCTTALCLAALLVASPVWAAKVYKWVDEHGVVNFSEHPPKNTKTEIIKPKIGHSEPVSYDTNTGAPTTNEQASTEETKQSLKDPTRCEISRKNLQTLQTFGRVRVPNEDGSFHYLTEEEQQERIKSTQLAIDESC